MSLADSKLTREGFSAIMDRSPMLKRRQSAGVVELADTPDLGSRAARREGSSPFSGTDRLIEFGHREATDPSRALT